MNNRNHSRIRIATMTMLLCAGVLPKAANAVLIDVIATGEVTEITNAILLTEFSLGQSMSMMITYDSEWPSGTSLITTQAVYMGAITGGSFTVGTYSGSITGGNINIENDDPVFFDGITFRGVATGADVGSLSLSSAGMIFDDPTATVLSNKALPMVTADLTGFPEQTFGLGFGSSLGGTPPAVFGRFTSLELTVRESVPEPSVVVLMAAGFGILSFGPWRRRITQRIF